MKYCLAFFGDLNDWLHRNHHFSFEPSGISKTKVLFQGINILQVADNVYLPMIDEGNAFHLKSFENVESTSEFLKKINLERIKDVSIEKVFSNLKGQNLPFYFTQPIKPEWKDSVEDLEFVNKIFENGPADISVVFVTKTKNQGKRKVESVATNGSQASSLLLFVHHKNQPESKKAESFNQETSLSRTIAAGPSGSEASNNSSRSSVKLFQYTESTKGKESEWEVVESVDLMKCLRGAKCILFQCAKKQTPDLKEFGTELPYWKLMLADLLKRSDEEIGGDEQQSNPLMAREYKKQTYRDHWKLIKDNFKNYFKSNPETIERSRRGGPIFLNPRKKSSYQNRHDLLESIFHKSKRIKNMLVPVEEDKTVRCPYPDCSDMIDLRKEFALGHHLLKKHRKEVFIKLECPFCGHHNKSKDCLRSHINREHGVLFRTCLIQGQTEESAPPDFQEPKRTFKMFVCRYCESSSSFHEDDLVGHQINCHQDQMFDDLECQRCQRVYASRDSLTVHINRIHQLSVRTGLKRKPEDFASPESKRTSQLNSSSSHPLSFPSVSSSEVQLLDNFKNIENETASTSYGTSMSYSDHLNSVHEHQEENSNVFLWPKSTDVVSSSAVENSDPFPNLSVVFSKDELDRLVPLHDDSNFNLLSQTYNALNEDEFY